MINLMGEVFKLQLECDRAADVRSQRHAQMALGFAMSQLTMNKNRLEYTLHQAIPVLRGGTMAAIMNWLWRQQLMHELPVEICVLIYRFLCM